MTTFAEDIEAAAGNEPIEAIVIAPFDRWRQRDKDSTEDAKGVPMSLCKRPISWADARPLLDYTFDAGYGGADCHAFAAWTPTRVLYVHEYDGSTSVVWVMRNPVAHTPDLSGSESDYEPEAQT